MAAIEFPKPPVDPSHDPLWHRIEAYDFDKLGGAYLFSSRLATENGWTSNYTGRVIEEYKRFCYLSVRAGHAVVPSDQIDQVWHLHLRFTREYRDAFCAEVLGTDLHHSPASNGDAEEFEHHRDLYMDTLKVYEGLSGERPPADIWPSPETQFGNSSAMRRVNTADFIIVRRPPRGLLWALQIALVIATLFARWEGEYNIALAVGFVTVALGVYRERTDNKWKIKPWRDGDDGGVGTGGCSSRGI